MALEKREGVMRSPLTSADETLLAHLQQEGFAVSRYQLERWRQHGLLPRAVVRRDGFGGCRVEAHDEKVNEAARVLAEVSGRGRPWQIGAVLLFEDGIPISTVALRRTAQWQYQQMERMMRRMASYTVGVDVRTLSGGGGDSEDRLVDAAQSLARKRNPTIRGIKRQLRQTLRARDPFISASELKERTEATLVWRIREILDPASTGAWERTMARYGTEDSALPDWQVSGPADTEACIRTITPAEAYAVRDLFVAMILIGHLPEPRFNLLSLITSDVAEFRINKAGDPSKPLPLEELEEIASYAQELWEEIFRERNPDQLTLFDIEDEEAGDDASIAD